MSFQRDRKEMKIRNAILTINQILCTFSLTSVLLSAPSLFAAEEICSECSQQVGVSGDFGHRKSDASVTIEGAENNPAAFREDINGKNFTVSISHLPAGKYTVTI